jgi:hypothetical protein
LVPGPADDLFVAVSGRQQKLGLFSASSGQPVRWLMSEPYKGMTVDSTSVDQAGRVWLTLSSGPVCTSNIAGCGPKPNSCNGEVAEISPSTDAVASVLVATKSELIADAQPSPDGRYLAYLDGRCDKSYFNQYIRVRDLTTGASWTIGSGLAPCHTLGSLSWTLDGLHLAVRYGQWQVTRSSSTDNDGAGICQAPGPATIVVVKALAAQDGVTGLTATAEPDCEIEALTATSTGYAAIEGCGANGSYLSGAVRLLRYSQQLQQTSAVTIGACVDGAKLRADQAGVDLLGTTYQFCNPPGTTAPKTVTFTDNGTGPKTIYNQPNGGETDFAGINW